MKLLVVLALVSSTGCRYLLGDEPGGGIGTDAPPGSGSDGSLVDAKPVDRCGWGAGVISTAGLCLDALPTTPLVLAAIDTDIGPCEPYSDATGTYCVVSGTSVTIGDVRITGKKPLIVISTSDLAVSGLLDLGARQADNEQAPGGEINCMPGVPPTNATYGGAGGSFGGKGGRGGIPNGVDDNLRAAPAEPTVLLRPTALRGGCKGQTTNATTGRAGFGGGAVYVAAYSEVRVEGGINASGAGGGGGPDDRGGGGGGSGGMIILDAPSVRLSGQLHADGGGGGEGGGNGQLGRPGQDGGGMAAATGGSGPALLGGDGGNGSYVPSANGLQGQREINSGGAGGGGTGMIWVRSATPSLNGLASPSVTLI